MSACGLDFGTSNTTLGVPAAGGSVLVALEGEHDTIPSAVFYPFRGEQLIGRAAIGAYVDGAQGRLMRALKSVLGNSLIDEETQIGRRRVPFHVVIGEYLGAIKRRAETRLGRELTSVVHGRPVFFVDGDAAADRKAEATLHGIATAIGFRDISFQFEPIAAALDYESQIDREEIALIADIGGGTSDFSIVRLSPERHHHADRRGDILANDGVRIGGTDVDRLLSLGVVMPLLGYRSAMKQKGLPVPSSYFHNLATWSSINRLYNGKVAREVSEVRRDAAEPALLGRLARVLEEERGHTLAMAVETAKIDLADAPDTDIPMEWIEPGLRQPLRAADLAHHTDELAVRIADRIAGCIRQAGLSAGQIDTLFLTGGSTRLAHIHAAIVAAVPAARVVDGDIFGSVGKGLTVEAATRYGG